MLTLHKFPDNGRTGNRLFQYASLLGIACKYKMPVCVPLFPEKECFKEQLPNEICNSEIIKEEYFHYTQELFSDLKKEKNYSLYGYWQSKKYWQDDEQVVKKYLEFTDSFISNAKAGIENVFIKETISIHIRRGDYVDCPHYFQLKITWFIKALISISNWQDCNIIIFSDDINYCRVHFACLTNVFFSEGKSAIEDVCLMSICDNHILSNSTLSWWGAYLSKQKNVIYPNRYFNGKMKEDNNMKDFWPENWNSFDAENATIDLKDTSFTIPVFYDSKDRKQNLDLGVCLLQSQFNTNIIIGEQGGNKFEYMKQWCRYIKFDEKYFHRTKMLNVMSYASKTPYVANWDADVVLPPMQVYLAVLALRSGKEMVFPYDGRFARWPRELWFKKLEKALDVGVFAGTQPKGHREADIEDMTSVGGAVFWNKESFVRGGMENEHMISFGPEDCERNDRYTMLGFRIAQIKGYLHHINHYIGENSSKHNPFFKANHLEIDKIRKMSKEQLLEYVSGWPWLKRTYIEK